MLRTRMTVVLMDGKNLKDELVGRMRVPDNIPSAAIVSLVVSDDSVGGQPLRPDVYGSFYSRSGNIQTNS